MDTLLVPIPEDYRLPLSKVEGFSKKTFKEVFGG